MVGDGNGLKKDNLEEHLCNVCVVRKDSVRGQDGYIEMEERPEEIGFGDSLMKLKRCQ